MQYKWIFIIGIKKCTNTNVLFDLTQKCKCIFKLKSKIWTIHLSVIERIGVLIYLTLQN